MLTEYGDEPVAKSTFGRKLITPEVELLRNTDTVQLTLFATARSGLPSPFKSPTLTDHGDPPDGKLTLAAKLTFPNVDVFRNTDTDVSPLLVTIISGLPSPSMSPKLTDFGDDPVT